VAGIEMVEVADLQDAVENALLDPRGISSAMTEI